MRTTVGHRENRLAATRDTIDTGAANGGIELRTGSAPTNVSDPATGTLLAFIEFTKPCGSIASGVLTLSTTADAVVVADGTVGYARWVDGDGNVIGDSPVSTLAGSAEVRISTLSLVTGTLLTTVSAELS